MSQRLVRAKQRIRLARIPFAVPDRTLMPERLPSVLEAIYGCLAISWREHVDRSESLAGEAEHLAVTLAELLETEPEAWALAALVLLWRGRESDDATFVPLDGRDTSTWDADRIRHGDACLRMAGQLQTGSPGRFQLEAAIQAVHCDRARTGRTDWEALRTLHTALLVVAPSLGARVALAAIVGRLDGAEAGLGDLDAIESSSRVDGFQPFHAARAELLDLAGRDAEAARAFSTAASFARDDATRAFLLRREAASAGRDTGDDPRRR